MNSLEAVFFWLSTLSLAISFFLSLKNFVFSKQVNHKTAFSTAIVSFVCLTIFGILRWVETGHPPFVTLFESMTNSVWFLLLFCFLISIISKKYNFLLFPVSFFGFLLMGWASSLETSASTLSATLENVWLFIHASFATAGAATFLVAASFSSIYLLGDRKLAALKKIEDHIPEYRSLPQSIVNLVIFGLILWGVMITSGSIWANAAWGRYWNWDPIELWSLISWLLYALVLHAKIGLKVSHRLFSWLTISAVFTVVFALWGVNYLYETIHTYG